ncbi:MAG: hypothetical protein K9G12_06230 [Candidatus Nanopelagicales bacterium]|nr:hypothetical protein [Candidatus Nanopelagicales bacterium]MCF8539861.1 hypothetical protein [Candidatus Nanopelagicales bacterium]
MSLNPIGPEPSSVYWVRRAAVVLVSLTLIIAVVFLARGVFGGESGTEPEPAATEVTETASASDTTTDTAEDTTVATGEPVDCVDSAIFVEATTDSGTYTVGADPVLTLSIENRGSVACLRDVGPKANELEIESGGYHVWSSDDCGASKKTKVVTLEPGDKVVSTITWNGQLSQKGCPDINKAAKPGRYVVIGRNLKVTSESSPFALTAKD